MYLPEVLALSWVILEGVGIWLIFDRGKIYKSVSSGFQKIKFLAY